MAENITLTAAEQPGLFDAVNTIAKRYGWTTRTSAVMLMNLGADIERETPGSAIARLTVATEGDLGTDGKGG